MTQAFEGAIGSRAMANALASLDAGFEALAPVSAAYLRRAGAADPGLSDPNPASGAACAPVSGADAVQPAVPLVRGPWERRFDVGAVHCRRKSRDRLRNHRNRSTGIAGDPGPSRGRAALVSDAHVLADGTWAKARIALKGLEVKATDNPPDDDPGGQPGPTEDHPAPTSSERAPEPRPTLQFRNADVDFRAGERSDATHAQTTDPDARPRSKSPGPGAAPCFIRPGRTDNRSGPIVLVDLKQANGGADRRAALERIHRYAPLSTRPRTPGADPGADPRSRTRSRQGP